jgi:hypothetical protein
MSWAAGWFSDQDAQTKVSEARPGGLQDRSEAFSHVTAV